MFLVRYIKTTTREDCAVAGGAILDLDASDFIMFFDVFIISILSFVRQKIIVLKLRFLSRSSFEMTDFF